MGISIGIRELRQNASRYLRLVRAGQTITLTDRGEPFAEIRPVKQSGGILERLIAEGRARPPTGSLKEFLDNYHPEPRRPGEPKLSDVLDEQREERL
jgi:prevent-host-death family protein